VRLLAGRRGARGPCSNRRRAKKRSSNRDVLFTFESNRPGVPRRIGRAELEGGRLAVRVKATTRIGTWVAPSSRWTPPPRGREVLCSSSIPLFLLRFANSLQLRTRDFRDQRKILVVDGKQGFNTGGSTSVIALACGERGGGGLRDDASKWWAHGRAGALAHSFSRPCGRSRAKGVTALSGAFRERRRPGDASWANAAHASGRPARIAGSLPALSLGRRRNGNRIANAYFLPPRSGPPRWRCERPGGGAGAGRKNAWKSSNLIPSWNESMCVLVSSRGSLAGRATAGKVRHSRPLRFRAVRVAGHSKTALFDERSGHDWKLQPRHAVALRATTS